MPVSASLRYHSPLQPAIATKGTHLSILDFIKNLISPPPEAVPQLLPAQETSGLPRIYPRSEHTLSRSLVSENALKYMKGAVV